MSGLILSHLMIPNDTFSYRFFVIGPRLIGSSTVNCAHCQNSVLLWDKKSMERRVRFEKYINAIDSLKWPCFIVSRDWGNKRCRAHNWRLVNIGHNLEFCLSTHTILRTKRRTIQNMISCTYDSPPILNVKEFNIPRNIIFAILGQVHQIVCGCFRIFLLNWHANQYAKL
jgi:hypothetical protein